MATSPTKTASSAAPVTPSLHNPEIVVVATTKVVCDGGGGALGHPKVWYDMSEDDYVECKYCDRVFALKGGSRDPGGAAK